MDSCSGSAFFTKAAHSVAQDAFVTFLGGLLPPFADGDRALMWLRKRAGRSARKAGTPLPAGSTR